jgi:hypothetical protein
MKNLPDFNVPPGYIAECILPDGRGLFVLELLGGRARLGISEPGDRSWFIDAW